MKRIKKAASIIKKIPGIHLISLFNDAWDEMPEEKKVEFIQNLIIAGSKTLAQGKTKF